MANHRLDFRGIAKSLALVAALILGIGCICFGATVDYTVKNSGLVSLGIYDGKGRLVRTLQSGKKQGPGAYSIEWDGKDDVGTQVPAGQYTCKGLSASVGCQFLMMMGNEGTPKWMTPDGMGGWGGTHGNVRGAAASQDGKSLYLMWGFEEGTPALLKVNPKGDPNANGRLKIWGQHNNWSWGFCQALAADGEYVYVGTNEGGNSPGGPAESKTLRSMIWRVRAENGDYAKYDTKDGLISASEVPMERMPFDTPAWEMYANPSKRRSVGFRTNMFALAVDHSNLYCSLRQENKIAVFDKKTGKNVREIGIKDPGGLAISPDGNLYVFSGSMLLKLTPEGEVLGTVIGKGLVSPYGMTVDKSGLIYITDQGASMQVKVFAQSGKLVKVIGKKGGRDYGGEWAKMKSDLLYPTQPAVLSDGTVYVGEDCAPKRVAIFKNGKYFDEWVGTLASGCAKLDTADEQNPQYLYQSYWPFDMVRYKVDYKKKTSVLDAVWGYCISINGQEVGDVPARQAARPSWVGGIKKNGAYQSDGSTGCIRHFDGKTYLFMGNTAVSVYQIDGYKLIPCGSLSQTLIQDTLDTISKDWKSRPVMDPVTGAHPCVWTDKNRDWEAQEGEVDWSLPQGWHSYSPYRNLLRPYVDEKMNVYFEDWKVPFGGLDKQGNPIYSWKNAVKLPTRRPMGKIADSATGAYDHTTVLPIGLDQDGDVYPGGRQIGIRVDLQDGSYYLGADMEGKGKGIGWAANGIYARIGKMDAKGNWVWMAGSKATGFSKPAQFCKPAEFVGVIKGCLFTNDWNGQIRIFDKDSGLYVGSLLRENAGRDPSDEYMMNVEFTEGHVFTNHVDGNDYVVGGEGCGLKVFQISGLDGIERFSAPVANR